MRRIEIASRTRHESEKIREYRDAQRNAVRTDQLTVKYFEDQEILSSHLSRRRRWEQRLGSSPLAQDQVSACRHVVDVNSIDKTDIGEEMHAALLNEMIFENPGDLHQLRLMKRELAFHCRQLKAMKDVDRVNSRLLYMYCVYIQ